jgi:inhibitor of cysteine peptidase
MNIYGIILTSLFSGLLVFFAIRFILEIRMNQKLKRYQKINHQIVNTTWQFALKRSAMMLVTTGLLAMTVLTGAFDQSYTLNDRVLVNAQPVLTQNKLKSLLNSHNQGWFNLFDEVRATEGAPEAAVPDGADSVAGEQERDFIDTNVQVQGVQEADIVKSDGNIIYYAARYQSNVRVIDILDNKLISIREDIYLEDFHVDNMFLTVDYLILIGYTFEYEYTPYNRGEYVDMMPGFYMVYTGSVIILDVNTLEEVYRLETDGYFYEYRVIDDVLFLVSRKSLYDEELRPMFKETIDEQTKTSYVDYDKIYYFDEVPIYSMTVMTSIKLNEDFTLNAQAFLSDVSSLYVSKDAIYTVFNYYEYDTELWQQSEVWSQEQKAQIIKYDLDITTGTINYVGQKIIYGHVYNQFWMDEYEGYFRVVTNQWSPILNRLYVLKEDVDTDELQLVSLIDEGLGKPNERVMSVRFNGDLAHVVTFEQIDPLYTIDLSDPYEPVFISDIEMPGFSTYLHPWLQANHLIGLGFDADTNGWIRGLKLSAFDTNLSEPLHEYILSSGDPDTFQYSYSEAHYNHKALLISAEHGIVAFPVMSYTYNQSGTYYEYRSQYYIFNIDFSRPGVISDPIIISHDISEDYYPVERGVYIEFKDGDQIERVVYTISFQQIISYHLDNMSILENIRFD